MAEQKKTLSAKEVVEDLRAGATDEFLMKKYEVSAKGLQSLFQKLVTAKVLTQMDLDRRASEQVEVEEVYEASFDAGRAKSTSSTSQNPQESEITLDESRGGSLASSNERSLDVLKDFAERFKLSRDDLQRLRTASISEIRELMAKYHVSLSDARELLKTLGISTSSLLTTAAGKLRDETRKWREAPQVEEVADEAEIPVTNRYGQRTRLAKEDRPSEKGRTEQTSESPTRGRRSSARLKDCPACGKEVAKRAKTCPHCGKKLRIGWVLKGVIGVIGLIFLGVIFGPSKEDNAKKFASTLEAIAQAPVANVSPTGELAAAFNLASKYTDVQREKIEKEIKGKVVQWTLPVYEVRKKENGYVISTSGGGLAVLAGTPVGTFITIYPRTTQEVSFVENLKTGDPISFKGSIAGTSMRNIVINPAILSVRHAQ